MDDIWRRIATLFQEVSSSQLPLLANTKEYVLQELAAACPLDQAVRTSIYAPKLYEAYLASVRAASKQLRVLKKRDEVAPLGLG
jgi:hypothetical protein